MYIDQEREVIKHLDNNQRPILLGSNDKVEVVAGQLKNRGTSIDIAIKSLRPPEAFNSKIYYIRFLFALQHERDFYEKFGPLCPQIVTYLGSHHEEDKTFELYLKRLTSMPEILPKLKTHGLPSLLAVAQSMSRYLKFLHHQNYTDNDFKLEDFGIEDETLTYSDGSFHPDTVKRMDIGSIQKISEMAPYEVDATPAYTPIYRFYDNLPGITLIKVDLFAFALSFYDLLTEQRRLTSLRRPKHVTSDEWLSIVIYQNHLIRFTRDDLLFCTNTPDQAQYLASQLNQIMEKALSTEADNAVSDIETLYNEFITCFRNFLTDEQFARLAL